ncbi:MAG: hypothetical protein E7Z90_03305 [Cyanobacteria bacterium SIG29]|nr:hypothetical protein [Cyanobacteria bacterium SIG29]
MQNTELYLKNLIAKDEKKAQEAACYMIDNADVDLYKALVDKSDYLFDFVRANVIKRIEKAINKDNVLNLLKFFDVHSSYYDDLFASCLAKNADQNLTDDIFELLEKGTIAQKTYAAKYFLYIPDTVALEVLSKYAFSDDEALSYNSAEALGQMQDDVSFDIALSNLSSEDDFEKLKAVKFFVAYGRNYPFKEIFEALKTSKMPENIAGQIPYMVSLCELLRSDYELNALLVVDNILSGLGEILPFSDVFQFELYEILEFLINKNKLENQYSGKIAEVLLKAFSKFKLFTENQEYIFDEDKDTKYEINSIYKLLQAQNGDFWKKQKGFVLSELDSSKDRILEALSIICEYKIMTAVDKIKELVVNTDEIIVCEALSTLKQLDSLDGINIDEILKKIQNENIKAIIENIKG